MENFITYQESGLTSGTEIKIDYAEYSDVFILNNGVLEDYEFDFGNDTSLEIIPISNNSFKIYFKSLTNNKNESDLFIRRKGENLDFIINFTLSGFDNCHAYGHDFFYRPFYFHSVFIMSQHREIFDIVYKKGNEGGNEIKKNIFSISDSGNTPSLYSQLFYSIVNGCTYREKETTEDVDLYKLGEVKFIVNDNELILKGPFRNFNEIDDVPKEDVNVENLTATKRTLAIYGIREPFLENDYTVIKQSLDEDKIDIDSMKNGLPIVFNKNGGEKIEIDIKAEKSTLENSNKKGVNGYYLPLLQNGTMMNYLSNNFNDNKSFITFKETNNSKFNVMFSVSEKEIMGYEDFCSVISEGVEVRFYDNIKFINNNGKYDLINNVSSSNGVKYIKVGVNQLKDVMQSLMRTRYYKEQGDYDGLSGDFKFFKTEGNLDPEGWDSVFTVVKDDANNDKYLYEWNLYNGYTASTIDTENTVIIGICDKYTTYYDEIVDSNKKGNNTSKLNVVPKHTNRLSVVRVYKGKVNGENKNEIIFE